MGEDLSRHSRIPGARWRRLLLVIGPVVAVVSLAAQPSVAGSPTVNLTLSVTSGVAGTQFNAKYTINTPPNGDGRASVYVWWDGYPGAQAPGSQLLLKYPCSTDSTYCSVTVYNVPTPTDATCGPHPVYAYWAPYGSTTAIGPEYVSDAATFDITPACPPSPPPSPVVSAPVVPGVTATITPTAQRSPSPSPSASTTPTPSPSPSEPVVAGVLPNLASPPPDDLGPLGPVVNQPGPQRSKFPASVPSPQDVSFTATTVGINIVLAALAILLIAFPSELFNSTLEENYEEVRGWFGPVGRATGRVAGLFDRVPGWLGAIPFILVMAALYGLLDPGFGISRASLALFVGLVAGLLIITVVFDLPAVIQVRLAHGHSAAVKTLPWSLAVAALCVLVSRLANFQPGYLYGLVAGLAVQGELSHRQHGKSLAVAAAGMFAVSVGAWIAWLPVRALATQPGASFWVLALDAALAVTFVCGLETMLFGLLPMRFLDGHKVYAWNRLVWIALFGLGVFGLIQVLLTPKSGYVGRSIRGNEVVVIVLLVGFAVSSVAFWSYFRFRPAKTSPIPD